MPKFDDVPTELIGKKWQGVIEKKCTGTKGGCEQVHPIEWFLFTERSGRFYPQSISIVCRSKYRTSSIGRKYSRQKAQKSRSKNMSEPCATKDCENERSSNGSYCTKCNRQNAKEWATENPERKREQSVIGNAIYRAAKIGLPYDWTNEDAKFIRKYWKEKCCFCGEPIFVKPADHHLEHWIPISSEKDNNPGTVPTNMLYSCSSCGSSKGSRSPIEWLGLSGEPTEEIIGAVFRFFEKVRTCRQREGANQTPTGKD